MNGREIIQPYSERDWIAVDEANQFAKDREVILANRHRVKIVVRCNQPDIRLAPCQFSDTIETTALGIQPKARASLAAHLHHAHPSLTERERLNLLDRLWYNLRDVGA
jgi:hypothetical protein